MRPLTNDIMQQNLQQVLRTIVAASSNLTSEAKHDRINDLLARNWAFNFYLAPRLLEYAKWLESSDERSNFTYPLKNLHHLKGWLAVVTGSKISDADRVVREIFDDDWLVSELVQASLKHGCPLDANGFRAHRAALYGRRIGWYGIVRLKKPRLVIETGVDRGLGSAILCRALMRNSDEGFTGEYLGTDINPRAGHLLNEPLAQFGRIAYGDSIDTLKAVASTIDVFINDSDHSAQYEADEYDVIADKLGDSSIVLGDNSHATDKLFQFAVRCGKQFLHFAEQPENHWYPGAGIGAAF
jgi:hypothetical protein